MAYPRKQTLIILLICALTTGGVAFYVYGGRTSTAQTGITTAVANDATQTFATTTDWQKQFLDSGSKTNTSSFSGQSRQTADDVPVTATDRMSAGFFTKYAELRKAGLDTDPKSTSQAMGQVVADAASVIPTPTTYSIKDVAVTQNIDRTAMAAYQKELVDIFAKNPVQANEAQIALDALTTHNLSALDQIDPIIAQYRKIINLLLGTAVPTTLADKHVILLNGFSIALYNSESLRHADTDPVRSLAAISLEVGGFRLISLAVSDIKTRLTAAGVVVDKAL